MKITATQHKRQEKEEKSLSSPHFSLSNLKEIVDFFSNLTESEKKIFNKFVRYFNYYSFVWPSQITIAKELGITRETVNRAAAHFQKTGFIQKRQRYNTSCVYSLCDILYDRNVRTALEPMFTSFKVLPLVWLLSCLSLFSQDSNDRFKNKSNSVQSEYVTVKNININLNGNRNGILISTVKQDHEKTSRTRQGDMENTKKREILEAFRENGTWGSQEPVSLSIKGIKNIVLTLEGQLKVGVFKDSIVMEVDALLGKVNKPLSDPFGWFMKVSLELSKKQNVAVDWWWWKSWEKLLHIPPNAPMFDKTKQTTLKRESINHSSSSKAWQQSDRVQESLDRLQKIYDMQFKLYAQGFAFEGLTYGELDATIRGTIKPKILLTDTPPTPPSDCERQSKENEFSDPYYLAWSVENKLHIARGTNKYSDSVYKTPNIFFNKLTQEKQDEIIESVHKGCECRYSLKFDHLLSKIARMV